MLEKLRKKLNSRSGETITETLVALLISALALVMLAAAISSAASVITRSREKLDAYYLENEKVINRVANGTNDITITLKEMNDNITQQTIAAKFYKNEEFTRNLVISYDKAP